MLLMLRAVRGTNPALIAASATSGLNAATALPELVRWIGLTRDTREEKRSPW